MNETRDHDHDHGSQDVSPLKAESPRLVKLELVQLQKENEELRRNHARLLSQATQALIKCLEEKDAYTFGHSVRVMEYAILIGRGAKLTDQDLKTLELSAVFHDIGKVGVADCVLLKPGKLTDDEKIQMQEHPVKSGHIIGMIDEFKAAIPGVRHHHERVDGKGYPEGLAGADIPWTARMILVADTFDAMTSTRPYRKAMPIEIAYAELERHSGTQFDPDMVKIFLHEHKKLTRKKKAA